tara:strand:+ start:631 stop:1305 length:675 start_codon:yes stop_codon:yes gene_type:complete
MHWFKHDTDANQDAKMQNVLLDYGLEGYGLYWYCIELIAGRVGSENITFELEHDVRILARNTGSTPVRVEEMLKYFIKIGLFECANNTVTCLKLAKRLDKSMTSNPQMREIIGNLRSHDSVMIKSEKVMQDKIRLDKNRIEEIEDKKRLTKKAPVKKNKTKFPSDFTITESMFNWFVEKEFDIDIEASTEKWVLGMQAGGYSYIDWSKAWMNGMIKAQEWSVKR